MNKFKKYLKVVLITSIIFALLLFVWRVKDSSIRGIEEEEIQKETQEQIQEETQGEKQEEISEDIREADSRPEVEKGLVDEVEMEKSIENQVQEKINQMTLEEKVAQLFIITPEALTNGEEVTTAGDITKINFETYPVGGLIYFSKNITTKEEVITMLANTQNYSRQIIGLPAFLSIDEEGGEIARIGNSETIDVPILPNMSEVGLTNDLEKAHEVGVTIGTYLSELGFNLDYAPVADVLTNSDNIVVKERSFGSDPLMVSQMVMEVIRGMNEQGIYGVLKHFPGHGATSGDTHEGYAYTNETLEEIIDDEMLPFILGIENKVSFIMMGHISAPGIIGDNTPSSLSKTMITDILRKKLGYEGIVITDALNMGAIQNTYSSDQAAIKAFQAGADLLLMPDDFKTAYDGILQAVRDGVISESRLNESLERIVRAKLNS